MMDDLSLEHPDLAECFDAGAGLMPAAVRDHLANCRMCAAELAEMAALRGEARRLPREIQPSRDLWTGISARITGAPVTDSLVTPRPRVRRPGLRAIWPSLAAAATVLIVVTSGVTAYLLREEAGAAIPIADAEVGAPPENPIGLAAFASAESEYRYTVETLEAELAARRSTLSPATIQAVEQNLAIIDNAIAEARRALAADPTSADLPLLLSSVYRQKVELLRQAVDLSPRS